MEWNDLAVNLVNALRIPLLVLVVWAAKKALPKIPRVLLPILAVVLSVTGDWIGAQLGVGHFSPVESALLGSAAVWLRELVSTAREHGTQP